VARNGIQRGSEAMIDLTFVVLSLAVFSGALVSGLAGFAFSAVAGAILLHVRPATEAVPLMMACSLAVQGTSLVALRSSMNWKGSLPLIAGGVLGIPPAVYLLHTIDAWTFRVGFGVLVASYAGYMLFRPAARAVVTSRVREAIVGFGGGLIGGLTAMPGALPTIWCDLQGMGKQPQRGLVQPFIAVMQIAAIAVMLAQRSFSFALLWELAVCLPALAAGTALGILMFGRVNDSLFRRIVLAVLFFSGLGLVL